MTLRSNAFYCKDARGSEEISNLALTVFCGHMRTQEEAKNKKKDATWLRLEVRRCKDARGSEEISNLALTEYVFDFYLLVVVLVTR